eukprot:TRINITY_DN17755_c0_g3_i3.p2 TRINITY_DN17755_c0_g3~~TRINITY_DN17755_c0_g3_i3.p2  ORF type:complete len:140 (-),score=20.11 TRINITY_DN17755_c0_g3_i3:860-1255(-)
MGVHQQQQQSRQPQQFSTTGYPQHQPQPVYHQQQQQLTSDLHHTANYRHTVSLSQPYPQQQQHQQQPQLLQPQQQQTHQHSYQQLMQQTYAGQQQQQHNGHHALLSAGDEVRYVRERTRGPSDYTYESIIS